MSCVVLYVVGLRAGERGIYVGVEVEEWRVGVWVSAAQAFLERERNGGK